MSLLELLPITAPALLIVAVAVRLTTRERAGRDTLLDLRDVPTVVLATHGGDGSSDAHLAPLGGALVDPGDGGSLGARLRSTVPTEERTADTDVVARVAGRVVLVRRRHRPLVALSRESSPS